ncbi:MgtC/SapB family protein [Mycolicibacterium arseniciresistens]|uniref:MgtC/SapB family protein n=1 Tax=Mycolicibacterium arseniciresistens TaxID=3062257 RepID=A0ABT8UFL1_9MYCO|nr:MgtC/SapB family protein [Mycolicibacterium arseniciresistens]MDO3635981.1 MgtC/SapB family protein [Mycolicibacterium arseniciresistens]
MLALELLTRVGLATALGIAIGFERQWRSRMAGLQTMALVSMGSALFLILSAYSFDQEGDRLRVAAQIVSGVGFLGAGVIMKHGLSVTGLNTAATLWATAAVGSLAGAWMWREAVAGAVIVVAGNWFLQPLGTRLDRMTTKGGRDVTPAEYRLSVVCGALMETEVKALVAQALPAPHFQLRAVQSLPTSTADQTEVRAEYTTAVRDDPSAENAIRALSGQAGVTSVRWSLVNEQAADWST